MFLIMVVGVVCLHAQPTRNDQVYVERLLRGLKLRLSFLCISNNPSSSPFIHLHLSPFLYISLRSSVSLFICTVLHPPVSLIIGISLRSPVFLHHLSIYAYPSPFLDLSHPAFAYINTTPDIKLFTEHTHPTGSPQMSNSLFRAI